MKDEVVDIKYDIQMKVASAINAAYHAGQSEDVLQTKAELEETLRYAQEAYEFFKVVMNRFCISENHLESTTRNYLNEVGRQLEMIKGIKR